MSKDDSKTKAELIRELEQLRRDNAALRHGVGTDSSDSRFRNLFDCTPLPYQSLDADGHILEVNRTWLEFMGGYERGEVLGRPIGEFLTEESRNSMIDRFREFKKTGTLQGSEFVFVRKNGSKVLTKVYGNMTYDPDGVPVNTHCLLLDITATRGGELALLESESKFRNLFQSSLDGIFYASPDGFLLDANPAFAAMVARSSREMQGLRVNDLAPDKGILSPAVLNQLTYKGFSNDVECELARPDGTRVPVSVKLWAINDDADRMVGLWGMARDVTEARAAQLTEARYRLLAENIADVIWTLDNNFRLTYISPSVERLRGVTPAEALRENLLDTMTPESYQRIAARYEEWNLAEQAGENGGPMRIEVEQYRNDGTTVWTECMVRPMFAENGRRIGMIGISRDISDRRQAEEALRESENEYRLIVETANEGIWIISKDDRTIFTNQALQNMLGFTADEMAWRNVRDFMPEDQVGDMLERKKSRMQGTSERFERKLLCKSGQVVWCRASTSPIIDSNGNFAGTVAMISDITARKEAEESLRLTQRSVDNASVAIYWIDEYGKFFYVNQAACDAHGYTREEMLTMGVPDIDPYLNEEAWKPFWETRRKQYEISFDTVHLRRDGSSFPVGITSHLMSYMDKEIVFTYAFDLTDSKRAEKELARSRKLLEEVQQLSRTGGWEINLETGETYWTEGLYRLFDMDPSQPPLPVRTLLNKYLPAEDRATFSRNAREIRRTGRTMETEYRIKRKDGTLALFKTIAQPEMDPDGRVRRVYGSTRDITRERRAQEELHRSHQRLLTILDGIDAEIYVSDLNTYEVLFVNRKFRDTYGEIDSAKPCWAQIKKGSGPCSYCRKPDLLDEDGEPCETIVWEGFDPETGTWLLNHDRAIQWLEGRMVHMQMSMDITDQKELEANLQKAKTDAESANRSKTEFLANMSHEIRTPLNGLLGMLQLLQLTAPTDVQMEYLDTALISSRNLLQILNDILDLSKIESGKLELYEHEFSLADLLRTSVEVFRHTAAQQGIDCSWTVEGDDSMDLLGDAGRIRQILFNLVGNAVKFTERGEVRATGTLLTACADGRPRLLFTITDTGIGIADEKLETIFDPFTQVDGSFTRKYQGTGLGLGIVRRLVNLMNGNISVESELGRGTTITFSIEVRIKPDESQERAEEEKAMSSRAYHILIAEDEAINQIVAIRLLEKLGHTTVCVSDGDKVLEALEGDSFDCILMDIQMPGMDGLDATQVIRQDMESDIPIIALTAHAMYEDEERFKEAGMNGFVSKPFELHNLRDELQRVLEDAD